MARMTYPEEGHARALHRALEALPGVEASAAGAGVHWSCEASRGGRSCSAHCFDADGAEYLLSFDEAEQTHAQGRTGSADEALAAVACWLDGGGVADLHARFAFVDSQRRALESLAAEARRLRPALEAVAWEVHNEMADLYDLAFTAGDRSCRVSFYGDNEHPDATFGWDGCDLFQFPAGDVPAFAAVLARWLGDRATPSALRAEFAWLEIAPLADDYEAGRGIEGEFAASWDGVEEHFRDEYAPGPPVLTLIAAIRAAGFDQKLRAGQSMYNLIVSRSRYHGLREGQPLVVFEFRGEGMRVYVGERRLTLPRVELDPRVEEILRDLAAQPVD
ncbi:MAG: hypothetical protein ACRC33_09720 [Gemmataceae bacterium]